MLSTSEYRNWGSLINNNKSLILNVSLSIYIKTNKEQTPHLTHYQQLYISDFYIKCYLRWIIGDSETGYPRYELWSLSIKGTTIWGAFMSPHNAEDLSMMGRCFLKSESYSLNSGQILLSFLFPSSKQSLAELRY